MGAQREARPFLIAAPASVLPNWEREFDAWAPDLKVGRLQGRLPQRFLPWAYLLRDPQTHSQGEPGPPAFVPSTFLPFSAAGSPVMLAVPWQLSG